LQVLGMRSHFYSLCLC